MTYDLKITGGTIVDGTGGRLYQADVGVHNGHLARIGDLSKESALVEIDVAGVPVRVEVGARPERGKQRRAEFRPVRVELVHVAVLAFAQFSLADNGAEIIRKRMPRMRRIEHQRNRGRGRAADLQGTGHPGARKVSSQ